MLSIFYFENLKSDIFLKNFLRTQIGIQKVQNSQDKFQTIIILAVGDDLDGKACLLNVLKGDPCPEETDYEPSIFENFHEFRMYQEKQYNIHLWDTAGQEDYDRLRPMSYAKADVILMYFTLDNPDSLKNVTGKYFNEVKEYCPKAPIILIGYKSELWKPEEEGAITQSQIDEASSKIGAYKTIICSIRNNENIPDIFDLAIESFLAKKAEENSNNNYICNIF